MLKEKVIIKLKGGLHARAAAKFVKEANKYKCDVFIGKDDNRINAKSIMGIMSLVINKESEIEIITDGKDEKEALENLKNYVSYED